MFYDKENSNKRWKETEELELHQMDQYINFKDLRKGARLPSGHKRITVHIVYNVKHDSRYKAKLLSGGHLTEPPLENIYSGIVSLRSLRIVIFLAEINNLKL